MRIVDPKPQPEPRFPATWLRYVPHGDVAAFEAKGWKRRAGLSGTHHGVFSVMMEWRGDGEPPK